MDISSAAECAIYPETAVEESEMPEFSNEDTGMFERILNATWTLIKGSAQMSHEEFCLLYEEYGNSEGNATYLLFRDIWVLIKGSAQMSEAEFQNLRNKYGLGQIKEVTTVVEEVDIQEEESNQGIEHYEEQETGTETSEEIAQTMPELQEAERIVLNRPGEKEISVTTKIGKTREWIIYSFMGFCVLLLVLLALRRI